jgi:hypothetical protein
VIRKIIRQLSPINFSFILSLILVVIKLVIYDYFEYFTLKSIPNHDLSESIGFFATNIHSMIISGEPAYWGPATPYGFAQYFQSFLSGTVPTTHNIVFILWSQLMIVLKLFAIHIPEYFQYLAVNTIILPFLTYFFLALFIQSLFKHRLVTTFATIVYAYSNIGLWNSAWFLYQESMAFWFILFSFTNLIELTNLKNLSIFCVSLIVLGMSVNYWTIFYSWYYGIIFLTYIIIYKNRILSAVHKYKLVLKKSPLLVSTLEILTVMVIAIWFYLLFTIVKEQSDQYIRVAADSGNYQLWQVRNVILEIRKVTTELFNPSLDRAIIYYPIQNPMHNARYLGIFLIPLFLIALFITWQKTEKWLFITGCLLIPMLISSPFAYALWRITPYINRIRQAIYFYSYFWDITLLVYAATIFKRILTNNNTKRLKLPIYCIFGGNIIVFIYLLLNSHQFPANDPNFFALSYGGLILFLSNICILKIVRRESVAFFASLFVFIALLDLTKYYFEVNLIDKEFTKTYIPKAVISNETKKVLKLPWIIPHPNTLNGGISENMPFTNHLWPDNTNYMQHIQYQKFTQTPEWFQTLPFTQKSVNFYSTAIQLKSDSNQDISTLKSVLTNNQIIFTTAKIQSGTELDVKPNFRINWEKWNYNDHQIKVSADTDGFLYLNQVHDPLWKFLIDKKPATAFTANIIGTAVSLSQGEHTVEFYYQPKARNLYKYAVPLTEIILIFLLFIALRKNNNSPK